MAKVVATHPAPKSLPVPGAEKSLHALTLEFDTGNSCDVTPSMKLVGEEARIAFVQEWERSPTALEREAVATFLHEEMGLPAKPEIISVADPELAACEHFLSGRKPS